MPPAPPFSYNYTPNIPELLQGLNCSIAISTYQTGKVVIFSAKDENQLVQLPRTFMKPMGMAKKGDKWAIATNDSVIKSSNNKEIAAINQVGFATFMDLLNRDKGAPSSSVFACNKHQRKFVLSPLHCEGD